MFLIIQSDFSCLLDPCDGVVKQRERQPPVLWLIVTERYGVTADHEACPVESEGSLCLQGLILQTALTGVPGTEKKEAHPRLTDMPFAKKVNKKTLPGAPPGSQKTPPSPRPSPVWDPQSFAGEAGGT